ncbi:SusD/RagB family nutrient-binding outer membrane lipoprotein [Paraflavitalea sp. CAU 1676]|uniref:SusD/RagB family nutrient-binding outer membrane lipoprotein n=1 Tax=Paraflavitalea sp. CAU 1676 TaxID=3032598 RepID=UPI0023DB159F|nr:SusD/RagB family nutrient-binding outer membrane lipoprotein [Paraflavitalea sp. CAU 1676]MDF2187250.1 SusD/RagB family nutrient-binding outer membrane lipoprotein [Paraflavitalea sp. CAU 1676]
MKFRNIAFAISVSALAAAGCQKKYDQYLENPNKPTAVSPNLILTGVLSDLNSDKPWSLVTRWCQFDACNYNYYGDQRYDWTGAGLNYQTLENVVRMEVEAKRVGEADQNVYATLGKFFRAYFFYRMTNLAGDLPLKDALKGLEMTTPAYDSQKEVFVQVLKWLDEANVEMAALIAKSGDGKIDGDFYFGTKSAWQRTINAFRLRVLIALSKKTGDADLKVTQSFAAIVADGAKYPLLRNTGDNLQYVYSSYNKYPSNPDNLGFDATRYNMSATYLNALVAIKDPRAFATAEPATKQLSNGKTPADITAYVGAPSGEDLAAMSSKMADAVNAEYSLRSRSRYYANYNAEPGVLVGYAEMCFNIAEAINRGWATGNAEDWYKKAIKASIGSYGIPVDAAGSFNKVYPYGATNAVTYPISFDFDNTYYQQASVKYSGNNATGLQQILLQKYLAFFQNSGWEAYFNWRRTGVPDFNTGTGTGNSGRIPKRFQYPTNERTTNLSNWEKAVKNQFGGTTDDINGDMWLIK